MQALMEGLKALGLARLAAMGAVSVAVLGLLAFIALRGGAEPMALLYADLDLREAGQIADQLDRAHIPHQEKSEGRTVMVPANLVDKARLLLARQGLPSGGSIGYEIFDRGDAFTSTQFQQRINQTRALEGELARTISQISGIRTARVHLVLPQRDPFARDKQEAQASVMLTMAGAAKLDREGVQAVLNLIAAAVPGLRPNNIAIVDSRGNLLARAGEPLGAGGGTQTVEELRHSTELRLARAVEEMLERTLGSGHVRAEAAVQMDFDRVNETQEKYDPDGQVVRSQQNVTDNNKTTEANATVSVQNNLPNAGAGATPAGSQQQRQEETTNYEIGKTVRTLVHDQPQIHRISLAVLVDGIETHNPDGTTAWQARSPEELARIGALVRTAIGYDEKRGDKVEVVNMRFAAAEDAAPTPKGLLGIGLERNDVMRLAETGLFGLIAVLALLLVLRPMLLRIATVAPAGPMLAGEAGAVALGGGDAMPVLAATGFAALPPPARPAGGEDERMIDIANIEGQMRASSIRRVAGLAEKHPEETLTIVRNWMAQGAER